MSGAVFGYGLGKVLSQVIEDGGDPLASVLALLVLGGAILGGYLLCNKKRSDPRVSGYLVFSWGGSTTISIIEVLLVTNPGSRAVAAILMVLSLGFAAFSAASRVMGFRVLPTDSLGVLPVIVYAVMMAGWICTTLYVCAFHPSISATWFVPFLGFVLGSGLAGVTED